MPSRPDNDRFKRALKVSTGVHVGVVVLLILAPLFTRMLHPRKPKEMVTFVDLVQVLPTPPAPTPKPMPPEPKEVPEPPRKPVVPEKQPEKPKPEPPKIKVNTNLVVRTAQPKPAPQPKVQLTPEQIKKLLNANIKFTSVGGVSSANVTDLGIYYAQVQQAMYGAWVQPGSSPAGARAEVSIRVQRSGAVTASKLTRSSGSDLLDRSILQAVHAVSRLPPLPADVSGAYLDISVEFVVGENL